MLSAKFGGLFLRLPAASLWHCLLTVVPYQLLKLIRYKEQSRFFPKLTWQICDTRGRKKMHPLNPFCFRIMVRRFFNHS